MQQFIIKSLGKLMLDFPQLWLSHVKLSIGLLVNPPSYVQNFRRTSGCNRQLRPMCVSPACSLQRRGAANSKPIWKGDVRQNLAGSKVDELMSFMGHKDKKNMSPKIVSDRGTEKWIKLMGIILCLLLLVDVSYLNVWLGSKAKSKVLS